MMQDSCFLLQSFPVFNAPIVCVLVVVLVRGCGAADTGSFLQTRAGSAMTTDSGDGEDRRRTENYSM